MAPSSLWDHDIDRSAIYGMHGLTKRSAAYRVHNGHVVHFPNVPIPVELFARLQEVDFAGERFLVPSPPEEYLRCK